MHNAMQSDLHIPRFVFLFNLVGFIRCDDEENDLIDIHRSAPWFFSSSSFSSPYHSYCLLKWPFTFIHTLSSARRRPANGNGWQEYTQNY